jgi:hypothetical protein
MAEMVASPMTVQESRSTVWDEKDVPVLQVVVSGVTTSDSQLVSAELNETLVELPPELVLPLEVDPVDPVPPLVLIDVDDDAGPLDVPRSLRPTELVLADDSPWTPGDVVCGQPAAASRSTARHGVERPTEIRMTLAVRTSQAKHRFCCPGFPRVVPTGGSHRRCG